MDIVHLALQTRSVTISPSSRLVNITAPTDLHRPSDPQVSTERPSSFSFACKAVGPCTGMSADLQTRDGVHTRRPTPWHQLLRAASVARAARPAAWSFRRVDAKVGPAISPVMRAGTTYQTPWSVMSVGASESPRCAPLPHRCRVQPRRRPKTGRPFAPSKEVRVALLLHAGTRRSGAVSYTHLTLPTNVAV